MKTSIPFRLAGGAQPILIVRVRVEGSGPFDFVLDTGAGTCLLAPDLAVRLGIEPTNFKEGMGAAGKIRVGLARVRSLGLGDAEIADVQVAITDEMSRIGAAVGARLDGNLGYNALKDFRLTIDYARSVVEISQEEADEAPALTELPFRLAHPAKPLILVPVTVAAGGTYQFGVDTGASTTVISPTVAREAKVAHVAAPAMTGAGGAVAATTGVLQSLAIGGVNVPRPAVMVADFLGPLGQAVGAQIDGIVGHNVLCQFQVTIDYPRQVLRLGRAS